MSDVSEKWDRRFLELARHISTWSRDPSTQTGAVIADGKRIISVGYNGFATGVVDTPERYANREIKYKLICHCERNAIIFAQRPLHGMTLYTFPFMSCSICASMVIQSGIKRCVAPKTPPHLAERWGEDLKLAEQQFHEALVRLDLYEMEGK